MPLKTQHYGLIISGIAAVVGIWYYKNKAAADAANSSDSGLGAFPYFQTAALPSSVTSPDAAGSAASGTQTAQTSIDLNSLAQSQATLQGHTSDNALQADWISFLGGNTTDLINSLTSAGFGTGGITASVTQGNNPGSFLYQIGASIIKSNQATNSTPPVQTAILPPVVAPATQFFGDNQFIGSNSGNAGTDSGTGASGGDSSSSGDGGDGGGDGGN